MLSQLSSLTAVATPSMGMLLTCRAAAAAATPALQLSPTADPPRQQTAETLSAVAKNSVHAHSQAFKLIVLTAVDGQCGRRMDSAQRSPLLNGEVC